MGPILAAFALHAACWDRYAVFRDELYFIVCFIVCGERLAAGYVDQPPLIAVIARGAPTREPVGDALRERPLDLDLPRSRGAARLDLAVGEEL